MNHMFVSPQIAILKHNSQCELIRRQSHNDASLLNGNNAYIDKQEKDGLPPFPK